MWDLEVRSRVVREVGTVEWGGSHVNEKQAFIEVFQYFSYLPLSWKNCVKVYGNKNNIK